jgi:hypothetical protein
MVAEYAETRDVLCIFGPPIIDPRRWVASAPGEPSLPHYWRISVSLIGWVEPSETEECRPLWGTAGTLIRSEYERRATGYDHWRSACASDRSAIFLISRFSGALLRLDTGTKRVTMLPYFPLKFPQALRLKYVSMASDGTWLWVVDGLSSFAELTAIHLTTDLTKDLTNDGLDEVTNDVGLLDASWYQSWRPTHFRYKLPIGSVITALPRAKPRAAVASASAASAADAEYPAAILSGGRVSGRNLSACCLMMWSPKTRAARWIPLPPLKFARSKHSALILDGKLVVIGGNNRQCLEVEALELRPIETAIQFHIPPPSTSASASVGTSSAQASNSSNPAGSASASASAFAPHLVPYSSGQFSESWSWESWPSLPSAVALGISNTVASSSEPQPITTTKNGEERMKDPSDRRQFAAINGRLLAIDFNYGAAQSPQLMTLETRPENGERFWRSVPLPVGIWVNPPDNSDIGPLLAFSVPHVD